MNALLVALLLLPLAQNPADSAAVQAGKTLWAINNTCISCHGTAGQGGFGPDLAGHTLTPAQFLRAVRKPWGIMPTFTPDKNFSDAEIGQIAAYLASLPKVTEPGAWRTPIPANASAGQTLQVAQGCGQCHGIAMATPRRDAGGEGADFEWFKGMVYNHTTAMCEGRNVPECSRDRLRMGNYSRSRLPEVSLRQIWDFMTIETGLRAPVAGEISAGTANDRGVTFTVKVRNEGLRGKGLTAENLDIALSLAPGTTVAATNGAGYQGVRRNAAGNADTAVWRLPRLEPGNEQTYTITVAGTAAAKGVTGGTILWAKPVMGDGTTDQVTLAPPQATQRP
jgi:mono/diheme cytochrome c family protein